MPGEKSMLFIIYFELLIISDNTSRLRRPGCAAIPTLHNKSRRLQKALDTIGQAGVCPAVAAVADGLAAHLCHKEKKKKEKKKEKRKKVKR